MASVSLHDVTKVFERQTTAVSHLTLEVPDGEFLVLVGPSGCGKTTILRLIAGLETPTSGEIRLAGRSISDLTPRNRNVAMVFQDGVLYPHLSVWDNLAFPLRVRGLPRKEVKRRVGAAVEMLDLADLVHRKPAALSGGQRQRVALGRALVRTPAAFLFDEPLSSADPALRAALRAQIKALHGRLHTTTLYVTHDQSEAMALGERIAVLQDGRIQQVGRPTDIYDRPVNRFVAGFFGTPPMNFLEGHIRFQNGTDFVDLAGGSVALPASLSLPSMESGEGPVVMGVRPHDLALEPAAGPGDNVLSGRVCLLEPFGARTDVHVVFSSGEQCIVSAPPHVPCRIEEEVRVRLDPKRLHLFGPDGAALDMSGGSLKAEGLGS